MFPTMSHSLLRTLVGLALSAFASTVQAVPLTSWSNHLLGNWQPGSGYNSDSAVTTGANKLVTWYNDNPASNPNPDPNATFSLTPGASVPAPDLPSPLSFGWKDDAAPFATVNPAVAKYVLGKYGNISYLFYLGNVDPGDYALPSTFGAGTGNGLSHVVAFNAPGTGVPDGGSTIALLGACMLLLEGTRRKVRRN